MKKFLQKRKEKRKEHKARHPILFRILSVVLIIALLVGAYISYAVIYRGKTEGHVHSKTTSTEPVLHNDTKSLKRALTMYPALKKAVFSQSDLSSLPNAYVIPGLDSVRTLRTTEDGTTKKATCKSMTPQGMAVTPNYIIISGYCHVGKHNSVLLVIDKTTGEFLKEIVLQGTPHAGGIAYDPLNDMLWISSGSSGIASIAAIPVSYLINYDIDAKEPIAYLYEYPIVTLQSASFICYYDKCIYVGLFSRKNTGAIYRYGINEDGTLASTPVTTTVSQTYKEIARPDSVTIIEDKIQGLAMNDDYQFESESWGCVPSEIFVHAQTDDIVSVFNSDNVLFTGTYPRMLEQICLDGNDMYLLFESAAYAYRYYPLVGMDYILRVDISTFIEALS